MNSFNFSNINLMQLFSEKGWIHLTETGFLLSTDLIAALLIFIIGKWLTVRIVRIMRAALKRAKVDATLSSFLCNVANIGLLILVIIASLGKLGVPTTSMTALVGGAGLAVALSLKDQLSNFAAGALIILFRPFRVGDYIKVNNFEGYVREIKMVQTSLRTYANEEVVLTNSVIMSNSITNKSSLPLWRAQVVVTVDYFSDLQAAKAAVLKAANDHPKCLKEPNAPSVQITGTNGSAEITLWAWTNEQDWWQMQCDLNESVIENLIAAKVLTQN